MTDDRIDYHRNRLRGVPLSELGRLIGVVLRDVAREAAEAERARMRPMTSVEIRALEVEVAQSRRHEYPSDAEAFARAVERHHGIGAPR